MPASASGDGERQTSRHGHPAGPRIVAGADGSPSSMSTLRWAIRQAGLTGAVVDAVIAWNYPASAGGYGWAPTGIGNFEFKGDAEKVLAGAISAAAGRCSAVAVHALVVEGDPAQVLLAACGGAVFWWWAAVGTAGSPRRCSAWSASTACITRTAPSS